MIMILVWLWYLSFSFQETGRYSEDLIQPILTCMSDSDSRVRYYACESLYNVTKVARENIISKFNEIFVSMTSVITDLVNFPWSILD